MDKWEYLTTLLQAQVKGNEAFIRQHFPELSDNTIGAHSYAPVALMPELNKLGSEGWELISANPVVPGEKNDILVHNLATGPGAARFSNIYLCIFKRRVA